MKCISITGIRAEHKVSSGSHCHKIINTCTRTWWRMSFVFVITSGNVTVLK